MSPPPTPFLTHDLVEEDPAVVLPGHKVENQLEIYKGDLWLIVETDYDQANNRTTCKLKKAETKGFMNFS